MSSAMAYLQYGDARRDNVPKVGLLGKTGIAHIKTLLRGFKEPLSCRYHTNGGGPCKGGRPTHEGMPARPKPASHGRHNMTMQAAACGTWAYRTSSCNRATTPGRGIDHDDANLPPCRGPPQPTGSVVTVMPARTCLLLQGERCGKAITYKQHLTRKSMPQATLHFAVRSFGKFWI